VLESLRRSEDRSITLCTTTEVTTDFTCLECVKSEIREGVMCRHSYELPGAEGRACFASIPLLVEKLMRVKTKAVLCPILLNVVFTHPSSQTPSHFLLNLSTTNPHPNPPHLRPCNPPIPTNRSRRHILRRLQPTNTTNPKLSSALNYTHNATCTLASILAQQFIVRYPARMAEGVADAFGAGRDDTSGAVGTLPGVGREACHDIDAGDTAACLPTE
jgi:hypothetical protein